MANNISQIRLPDGNIYDIHDAAALHNLDFIQVMEFKGVQNNEAAIKALTNQPAGAVYHASAEGTEWLCTTTIGTTANSAAWEEMGNPLVDNHNHTATVNVTGTVKVPTQTINSSGSYTPNVTASAIYAKVDRNKDVALSTSNTSVINSITPGTATALTSVNNTSNASFVTGLKAHTSNTFVTGYSAAPSTANFLKTVNSTNDTFLKTVSTSNATPITVKSINSVGTSSNWSFSVNTTTGILTIAGGNGTVPTTNDIVVSKLGSSGNATYATGGSTNGKALTSIGSTNGAAVTGLPVLSTSNAITAVGGVNTSKALTGISFSDASFVNSITTTNTSVLTSASVSQQPVYALATANSTTGIKTGEDVTVGAKNVNVSGSFAEKSIIVTSTGSITTSEPKKIN